MWMYKDGITRWVEEREAQSFKDMGFKEVKVEETKLEVSEKGEKKSDDKNGAKAQNKADAL